MNNPSAQTESAELLLRILFVLEEIRDHLRAECPQPLVWLTTEQVVQMTGRNERTLRRWRLEHDELKDLAPDVAAGQGLRWHRDAVPWLRQRGLI